MMVRRLRIASAFSMIEILLVVVILSVIAGLAVPNFSRTYANIQLKKSTQNLVYTMRYAQSRAVTRGSTVRLIYDADKNAYWLEEAELSTDIAGESFQKIPNRQGRVFRLAYELNISFQATDIRFYADGAVDKEDIRICRDEECWVITTKLQRGHIHYYEQADGV